VVEIMTEWTERAGAFLFGRKTYEIFAGSWPWSTDPTDRIAKALNTPLSMPISFWKKCSAYLVKFRARRTAAQRGLPHRPRRVFSLLFVKDADIEGEGYEKKNGPISFAGGIPGCEHRAGVCPSAGGFFYPLQRHRRKRISERQACRLHKALLLRASAAW
jgi:hypothetical protein